MVLRDFPTYDHPEPHNAWDAFAQFLTTSNRILVLVGAGLSAPSGLTTWSGTDGLWNNIEIRDLASPYKFREDPVTVWQFYSERIREALEAQPNPGHLALARFAERHVGLLTISQNIDGLSECASHPLSRLHTIHGSLKTIRCSGERDSVCEYSSSITSVEDLPSFVNKDRSQLTVSDLPHCPKCSSLLRPAIVWFGEKLTPRSLEAIDRWIGSGTIDLVLAIGTSLAVFPAAEFVETARMRGARLAVVNKNLDDGPASGLEHGDWFFEGNAAEILPMILK